MQERKMIEVSTTREIARAYDRAHAERAQAFKQLFRLPFMCRWAGLPLRCRPADLAKFLTGPNEKGRSIDRPFAQ